MTNKILLDGWNVCHKIPAISQKIPEDLQGARTDLRIMVQNYGAGKKINFRIIFDGQPGYFPESESTRQVEVQFSRNPESADHKIIRFLSNDKNPRQWTVITSDRELAIKAKGFGCTVLSSELFISKMKNRSESSGENREKNSPQLSPDEMKFWLDTFNRNS